MIEHPEAVNIAGQIAETLTGKRIESATRGNTPHKWAFYSRSPEEYASILKGQRIEGAEASGSLIVVHAGSEHVVALGGGGERITFHKAGDKEPTKHHLLLRFEDGTFLSVRVQGWGSCQLWTPAEMETHGWFHNRSLSPTDDGFTPEYFDGLFGTLKPGEARSIKYFLISEPGVWGIGNGYLQDILLSARLHPRARAVDLDTAQRQAVFTAITATIERAVRLRGRTDEYDLFGNRGTYQRLLHAKVTGTPCPQCGQAPIEKGSFLGGAIYTCPSCQGPPPAPIRRARRAKK
ncbi:MAG: hypothetical protein HN380_14545 [Victivallales bacterium]|nr:hypothetical protein [Victivallales bacterium]